MTEDPQQPTGDARRSLSEMAATARQGMPVERRYQHVQGRRRGRDARHVVEERVDSGRRCGCLAWAEPAN